MLDDRNETPSSFEVTDLGIWDRRENLLAWARCWVTEALQHRRLPDRRLRIRRTGLRINADGRCRACVLIACEVRDGRYQADVGSLCLSRVKARFRTTERGCSPAGGVPGRG
ncbi:hypothetical protein [Streptomyces silvisoli]|uniref:Uncharacterized protein n=1 Tax=Streptomyces silvisoli TaxID=3034235 RepID=A0ABT5ZNZ0_9ACTN|nr:hypothetical protein [Streptomyces silvisoli]MDF3290723.1 hypothetical protein [Streptomyces silvisoli]